MFKYDACRHSESFYDTVNSFRVVSTSYQAKAKQRDANVHAVWGLSESMNVVVYGNV